MFSAMRWCLGLFALCLALTAWAQDFESTKRAARQGDAQAQADLGKMYATGQGVTQNHAEAVRWYRKERPMPAKPTSKNRITPPKAAVSQRQGTYNV